MPAAIDPWGRNEVKDYGKIMADFGLKPFDEFAGAMPDAPTFMRRGGVFAHRDFGRIFDCVKGKKPFAMLTGLMPSGKFHLGHAMLAQQIIYYQQLGAKVFVTVADIEAYNVRKLPLAELRKIAIEEYILNYFALGLKPKGVDIYFQSERSIPYYRLIGMLSGKTTANEFKAIYGSDEPEKFISVAHQIADILHPQLPDYLGPIPLTVPVGIDQDPHIRYTRDITGRLPEFSFIPPSSTYHKFMKGLQGGKMSSSDPLSYIALTDAPEEAERKIMKHAFSGGRNNIAEHRRLGADLAVDVSYQYLLYLFEPDDAKMKKITDDYGSGKMLSGEVKQYLAEKVRKFLQGHQKKREKARNKLAAFSP
ncbi:MAG: tryptophan--tRNA ligase [Candidatus Aenigmarchaeota archaeon]|nr:tryptophan--tRNA ligase [Candidatus Aenigmarchaeota archaeon]